jgi:hypothetical protein
MSARGFFPSACLVDETHHFVASDLKALRRASAELKAPAFPYAYTSNAETASSALSVALERAINRAVAVSVAKREAELVEHFARRYGVDPDPDIVRRIVEAPHRLRRHREEAATRGTALHALLERQARDLSLEPLRIELTPIQLDPQSE